MLVLAGTLVGLLAVGTMVLLVLGFAAFVDRRWKDGLISLAAGVGSLPIVMMILAGIARLLISADLWKDGAGPEVKARALAENISGLMNISVFGLPVGLFTGVALVWRRRARTGGR